MPQVYIRPELLYGWHGQTLLIVSNRGDCGDEQTLSGFYFREARYLRTLRLTLNGQQPWLAQAAVENPAVLHFWRGDDGDSHAEVLHQRGTLRLVKQPPLDSLAATVLGRRAVARSDGSIGHGAGGAAGDRLEHSALPKAGSSAARPSVEDAAAMPSPRR